MQKILFAESHGYKTVAGHEDVSKHIVAPHGLDFNPRVMQDTVGPSVQNLTSAHTAVISSELLCGNPFFGGRESDIFADRLRRIFPGAKILITIRSQQKILLSTYMQYLSRGGKMTPEGFFTRKPDPGYYAFDFSHFEFDRLVKLYQELFRAENVYVLTQESLKFNADRTCRGIAEFCGNKVFTGLSESDKKKVVNSYPEHASPVLRRINHFRRSTLNPHPVINLSDRNGRDFLYRTTGYFSQRSVVAKSLQKYRPVSAYIEEHCSNLYASSNSRLTKLVSQRLDLSEYDLI